MEQTKKVDILELAWQVEEILQAASTGDYSKRCKVSLDESFSENPLATIIPSINLLLDDLQTKERKRKKAEESLHNTITELKQKVDTVKQQAHAIRELSTPAIEVWDGILVMPIIGVVDTARGQSIMDEMLSAIAEKKAKFVILDITGVDIVDTAVANHLVQVVRGGYMLGAKCVLTGINPAVAQSIVAIGADLRHVTTLRSLKEGLSHCLSLIQKDND